MLFVIILLNIFSYWSGWLHLAYTDRSLFQVDNFIHADMHPGNILVRVTNSKASPGLLFKSRPHVIFLDVGMTAELSKRDRVNLLEFFKAVALQDGRNAAECTLRLSKQQNCPNPKAFIEVMHLLPTFSIWLAKICYGKIEGCCSSLLLLTAVEVFILSSYYLSINLCIFLFPHSSKFYILSLSSYFIIVFLSLEWMAFLM